MRLSLHTDLSLRMLVFLASNKEGKPVGSARIAVRFNVSAHHMQKVAQKLRKLGYITSQAGRIGGLTLAKPASSIRIGDVVLLMEGSGRMADCARGPCIFNGACALKRALDKAERGFIEELQKQTLSDVIRGSMYRVLQSLPEAA